jgi:hypothetical protein
MTYELLNSDYKTLQEVILDFPYYKSAKTLKRALDKKGIPTEKRGKTVVIKKDDVCIFFRGETTLTITSEPIPKKIYKKPISSKNLIYEKKIKDKIYGS